MISEYQTISVTREGPVATVALDRPALHNAFHPTMIAELQAAFESLGRDDASRVLILRGEGRSFSAGADLEWMRTIADQGESENLADALRLADMLAAIRDCPRPVIARVHGACMGGGTGLVAACDIAVAAEGTRFAFSEARLGLAPAVIAPFVLPRIGITAARELFLTGERFDAERAKDIGLISHAIPAAALDETVEARANALLAAAPEAQAAIKGLIRDVYEGPSEARERTAALIARLRGGEEGRNGMAAFLSKEAPPWQERSAQ